MNQQQPRNRSVRRQDEDFNKRRGNKTSSNSSYVLPGPLAILANPKLFLVVGIMMAGAIILGLMSGILFPTGTTTTDNGAPMQANELPDVPRESEGTVTPGTTPTPAAAATKRYTAAPELAIDPSTRYVATIKTSKGDIQVELDPAQAPQAVNSFVFLANDGYYNKTPFMQVVTYKDGGKFYAQAGDPTRTGLGTPGYSVQKESTTKPFVRGAVGMCGNSADSNGGQFFISYVDDPAVKGCTIFGQVTSGMDVVDRLSLLQVSNGRSSGTGDEITAVTVAPK